MVIPEDEANRQIMTGFLNHLEVDSRRIHVDPVAGGWQEVIEAFVNQPINAMKNLPHRHILMIVDFDGNAT